MKIKICGMGHPDHAKSLETLGLDFLGMIDYPRSPRYMGEDPKPWKAWIPVASVRKVLVTVNESLTYLLQRLEDTGCDVVQLHGEESPQLCEQLKHSGYMVIKAFGITNDFDTTLLNAYASVCDYFLFDTASPLKGGTGQRFDQTTLRQIKIPKPFFLSGGIGQEELLALFNESPWEGLEGIDLNSKLEIRPGLKNVAQVAECIQIIRNQAL